MRETTSKKEDLETVTGPSGVWLYHTSGTNAPVHVNTKVACTFSSAQPPLELMQPSCGEGGASGAKCGFFLLRCLQLNYCLWPLLLNVRVADSHTHKKNTFRSTCMRSWVGVVAESHQRLIFTTVINDHFSSVNKHRPCATSAGRPMQEDYPRQLILHSSRRHQKRSLSGRYWLAQMNVCQSRSNHIQRQEWNVTIYIEHKGAQFERFHYVQVQTFTHELYILLNSLLYFTLCVKCYSSRKNPESFW